MSLQHFTRVLSTVAQGPFLAEASHENLFWGRGVGKTQVPLSHTVQGWLTKNLHALRLMFLPASYFYFLWSFWFLL